MMMIYSNTIVQATPYLLGMVLAYILANKMTIKMPKWWVAIEWLLNIVLCLTLIYIIVIPYSRDYVYDKLGAAFFAAFHRVGWSVGIGWVIWACVNGYAGNEKWVAGQLFHNRNYILCRSCELDSLVEVLCSTKQAELLRLFGAYGYFLPFG
jgi:hypothetical protein